MANLIVAICLALVSSILAAEQIQPRIMNDPPPPSSVVVQSSTLAPFKRHPQHLPHPEPFDQADNRVLAAIEERIDFEAHLTVGQNLVPEIETFHAKHGAYFRENFPFFFERVVLEKFREYKQATTRATPVMKLIDLLDSHGNKTLAALGLTPLEKELIVGYVEPGNSSVTFSETYTINKVYRNFGNISDQLSLLEAFVSDDYALLEQVVSRPHKSTFSPYWERIFAYLWPSDSANLATVNGTQTLERHVRRFHENDIQRPLERANLTAVNAPIGKLQIQDEIVRRSNLMVTFASSDHARQGTFAQTPLTVAVQTVRMFQLSLRRLLQHLLR